jgi:hypothetical protein
MEEEVDVRINEAGKERHITKVDDLRALGVVHRHADRLDSVALDENLTRLKHGSGVDLEQAGGVKNDGWRGVCSLQRGCGSGDDHEARALQRETKGLLKSMHG